MECIRYYNPTIFEQKWTKYEKYGEQFYLHAEMIVSSTRVSLNMAMDVKQFCLH